MLIRNIILYLFLCFQFLFSQSISYNDSWAIIVGINDYENENIPDLNYAVSDAEDIKSMLIDYYGFKDQNITMLLNENATKRNILKEISGLPKKTNKDDRIIIFYAGHGMTETLPAGGEMGYLVPYEGDLEDLYLSSIPMKELRGLSDRFDAKHVLFLVDACYGGLAAVGTRGLSNQIAGYYDKIFRGKARQIITAGGKGETVIEKADWGHSAFTHNLLRGLKDWMADLDNDGYITGEELGIYLKRRVTEDSESHQTPTVGRFSTDQGEFMFSRPVQLGGFGDKGNPSTDISIFKPQDNPSKVPPIVLPTPEKKIATAKLLSLAFPGAGHFYMGNNIKGTLWSSAGLVSLAGTIAMYSDYNKSSKYFSQASNEYVNYSGSEEGFVALRNHMTDAQSQKESAKKRILVFGGAYLGVVIANYFTINSSEDDYSYHKFTGGITPNGSLFISYKF